MGNDRVVSNETKIINFNNSTLILFHEKINGVEYGATVKTNDKIYLVKNSSVNSLESYTIDQSTISDLKPFKAEVNKIINQNGSYKYVIERVL